MSGVYGNVNRVRVDAMTAGEVGAGSRQLGNQELCGTRGVNRADVYLRPTGHRGVDHNGSRLELGGGNCNQQFGNASLYMAAEAQLLPYTDTNSANVRSTDGMGRGRDDFVFGIYGGKGARFVAAQPEHGRTNLSKQYSNPIPTSRHRNVGGIFKEL